jgi:hypothetical protein
MLPTSEEREMAVNLATILNNKFDGREPAPSEFVEAVWNMTEFPENVRLYDVCLYMRTLGESDARKSIVQP